MATTISTMGIEWDKDHDWTTPNVDFDLQDADAYKQHLTSIQDDAASHERNAVQYSQLNDKQQLAHDMILTACRNKDQGIESSTDGGDGIGRLQLLLGKGGTGKSFNLDAVIESVANELNWTHNNCSKHGTTGIASTNIGGSTLQNWKSGLGFCDETFQPLSPNTLKHFQEVWKDRKMIIIDEFSMLKQRELHYVNKRLKQIMCSDEWFGGLIVLLIGDPAQLPPVKGKTAIKLTESNRLDKDDADAVWYDAFLERLRNGKNTDDDWDRMTNLASRHTLGSARWRQRGFYGHDVIHLYTTNKEVSKRNLECLKRKQKPIVRISSVNTGRGKQASPNQAGGLVSTLYLCEGAKVLLTKNIAQQVGLCNGSTGMIVAFVYENDKPPPNLPEYVIVDFGDSYKGRPFFGDDPDKAGWVPIFPETHEWQS